MLELQGVCRGNLRDVSLGVSAGECVVIQDMDGCAQSDLLAVLAATTALSSSTTNR